MHTDRLWIVPVIWGRYVPRRYRRLSQHAPLSHQRWSRDAFQSSGWETFLHTLHLQGAVMG